MQKNTKTYAIERADDLAIAGAAVRGMNVDDGAKADAEAIRRAATENFIVLAWILDRQKNCNDSLPLAEVRIEGVQKTNT